MWVMFFVSFIPLCGIVIFGAYFLFFAVPVVTARSWWRIRAIGKSEDPALKGAMRYLRTAAIMWALMFVPMAFNVLGTFMRR